MHLTVTADHDLDVPPQSASRATASVAARPTTTKDGIDLNPRLAALAGSVPELSLRFEEDEATLWCGFRHPERPCFSRSLLIDIKRFQRELSRTLAGSRAGGAPLTLVWHSEFPDVWNLGGDLELFVELIRAGDRETLRRYAHACCETVHTNWTKGGGAWRTVALIEGDALGGGFEAALTNDVIIAEKHSKFGLPEILFNMFPGMGAYSFLSRRIGGAQAEALITSGRLYSADEMQAMGIVDLVVPTGEGKAAVKSWVRHDARRRRVATALDAVKRRCQPVSFEELIDVTEIWVDTALGLAAMDLRKMERLAKAQHRRRAREVKLAAA